MEQRAAHLYGLERRQQRSEASPVAPKDIDTALSLRPVNLGRRGFEDARIDAEAARRPAPVRRGMQRALRGGPVSSSTIRASQARAFSWRGATSARARRASQ
jgi:hypothetical protein